MITIFSNFCQFSAKKLVFFSKTNVVIQFLHNLFSYVLSQKRQFFNQIFRRKHLKNHNIGPRIAPNFRESDRRRPDDDEAAKLPESVPEADRLGGVGRRVAATDKKAATHRQARQEKDPENGDENYFFLFYFCNFDENNFLFCFRLLLKFRRNLIHEAGDPSPRRQFLTSPLGTKFDPRGEVCPQG
jgi:hypothetical protein